METIDDETSAAAIDYIKRQNAGRQALLLLVQQHADAPPDPRRPRARSPPGLTARLSTSMAWSSTTGPSAQLLKALDDLGIADNTIVVYTTDNGPHMNTWPDGAMTPFRSEKNTNWEGRLPRAVHDPLAGQDQTGHGVQRDRQRS